MREHDLGAVIVVDGVQTTHLPRSQALRLATT